ncbi:E3 ubiquitin-protein ligase RFWD3 [Phytophthora citrophthora]|uniref:RING-type E3 ubiquitin transferase n=1 Tax=Phytophthora citrophthora TaxID=4793 RepID=A0AAD9G3V8_9STRA|nr:E3 ubiquitin-protein ligase RFWD3 [Phytophthora citrophthora]
MAGIRDWFYSDEEVEDFNEEDSDNNEEEENSDQEVVNLASPYNTPNTQTQTNSTVDDDDIQILTPEEAAVEAAAAAQRALENPNASRKRKRPMVETKAEATECSICCEDCTLVGVHRLVALKCGHLFGKKCIERWINEKRTCPNCNAVVRRPDICPLFSDHVAVVDNSGLENMTTKFEEEKKKTSKLEKEVAELKQQLKTKTSEATQLRADLTKFKRTVAAMSSNAEQKRRAGIVTAVHKIQTPAITEYRRLAIAAAASSRPEPSTHTEDDTDFPMPLFVEFPPGTTFQPSPKANRDAFCKYKPLLDLPLLGARVFRIARSCSFLCVGDKVAPSSHGIMMVDISNPRSQTLIPVHTSEVRDIAIHHAEKLALTTAFDGKLALTSFQEKKMVLQIDLPASRRQGWSCSFSEAETYAMYCGFQDGTVAKYDLRKATCGKKDVVKSFALPDRQPVHTIKLFKTPQGTEGLVAATFRGLFVWRDVTDVVNDSGQSIGNGAVGATPQMFFRETSNQTCYSLASNQLHSNQVVGSSRSTPSSTPTKHSVFDLHPVGLEQLAPRVEFSGHKAPSIMSRSALWSEANGTSVVASWSQDTERVALWNVATHREVGSLEPSSVSVASATRPIVDIQHSVAKNNWNSGVALLGTMTNQQISVYRSVQA